MRIFVALVFLLVPAALHAQSTTPAPPDFVDVMVIPATGDPTTVAPIANLQTPIAVSTNCNLAPSAAPPTPLINPRTAEFDDPFTTGTGRVCRVPLPSGLPNGNGYRSVAVFVANNCVVNGIPTTNCRGPRSAVGLPPFNISPILTAPVAPTNLGNRP